VRFSLPQLSKAIHLLGNFLERPDLENGNLSLTLPKIFGRFFGLSQYRTFPTHKLNQNFHPELNHPKTCINL
jgi:hypothetical protein